MKVAFTQVFLKCLRVLPKDLQEEAIEKIELFKDSSNHKRLKVHKLKGVMKGRYSFSVNYKIRIVFSYLTKDETVLHSIGDHDIYK